MRTHAFLAAAAVVLGGAPLSAQSVTHVETVRGELPTDAGAAQSVDGTTQTQDVEFSRDASRRMTVAVTLVGSGPYRFLVDTGADRTVVSRQLAERLKLRSGRSANLHSVTGISSVGTAAVPHLQISQRSIRGVEAAVLEGQHIGADGVLGTDSLIAQNVLFDFRNGLLSITPTARRAPRDEEGTIVVEARRRNGRLIITEAEANDRPLSVVIDTGAELTIGNEALRQMLLGRRQLSPNGTIELQSVTGAVLKGDYLTLKELKLGGVTLHDLNIVFADAHSFRQMGLEKKPALLLGMNAMRAFDKVSIDFARKKLRVVMPKGSELDSETRMAMR